MNINNERDYSQIIRNQNIAHKGYGKFLLTNNLSKDKLWINFEPIIVQNNLQNTPLVFAHFQAKPKGMRTWGFYDSISDTYISALTENIDIDDEAKLQLNYYHIDELVFTNVAPTYIISYNNCFIKDAKQLFNTRKPQPIIIRKM